MSETGRSVSVEVLANGGGVNDHIFAIQRHLRSKLLDEPTIRYAPARDLAAHMLLNLDDLTACWSLATNWLRSALQCQRVDSGFGTQQARDYFPGLSEAKNTNFDVPSFGEGRAVDNRDNVMQAMWMEPQPLILADIKHDSRVSMGLRQRLSGARTKSKFATAMRTQSGGYGLICADWTEHFVPWESGLHDCFEQTVVDVVSPIIAAAKEISERNLTGPFDRNYNGSAKMTLALHSPSSVAMLTVAEIEVAKLVAQGLSYKAIAGIRGRSFSTIDHQLRSIRQKTGTSSTSALVSLLAHADIWDL